MVIFKNTKIFIAGHKGLLGSALLKLLRPRCRIVVRNRQELDLTDQNAVYSFFKKERPELVFLTAGLSGGILANQTHPATFMQVNLAIQNNVFQAAQDYMVRHLVFYGCSCMYPKYCHQPIKEKYLLSGYVEETSRAYAIAKIAGISACKAYNDEFNTRRFIALVPASIYGPGDNFDLESSHVLGALMRKFYLAKINREKRIVLWGSGKPQREFIYSEDVAYATLFALENVSKLQNYHYNIGTGKEYSIKDLAGIVAKIVGFTGSIEWDKNMPDGNPRRILDSSEILKLGWKPLNTIENGIKLTYKWYLRKVCK